MAQAIISDRQQYVSKAPCSCISCHVMSRAHNIMHDGYLHPPHHHNHGHASNACSRTCFSHIASNLMPSFPAPPCSCSSTPSLEPWSRSLPSCPCARNPHPISRCHHRTPFIPSENQSRHTPLYAQAFSPPPLVHASWESTRETNISQGISHMSTSPEYFTELEHHHRHYHRRHRHTPYVQQHFTCPPPVRQGHMHNLEQDIHNLAWRHYRRHFARDPAYQSIHPAHLPRHLTFHYRTPEVEHHHHHMPYFTFNVDLQREFERMEMEIQQGNNTHNEPNGLSKKELDKLPSYFVTKKTLEEFSDSDRCVVCMSEFEVEENLRILPCAHEFHSECVDKWLSTNPTCPICRAVVKVS